MRPHERTGTVASPLAALVGGLLAGGSDEEFARAITALRVELAATNLLETILVEQILLAAARLRRAALREGEDGPENAAWLRYHGMAERGFWKAWRELDRLRRRAEKASREQPKMSAKPEKSAPVGPTPDPVSPPKARTARPASQPRGDRTLALFEAHTLLEDGLSPEDIRLLHPDLTDAELAWARAASVEDLAAAWAAQQEPEPRADRLAS